MRIKLDSESEVAWAIVDSDTEITVKHNRVLIENEKNNTFLAIKVENWDIWYNFIAEVVEQKLKQE